MGFGWFTELTFNPRRASQRDCTSLKTNKTNHRHFKAHTDFLFGRRGLPLVPGIDVQRQEFSFLCVACTFTRYACGCLRSSRVVPTPAPSPTLITIATMCPSVNKFHRLFASFCASVLHGGFTQLDAPARSAWTLPYQRTAPVRHVCQLPQVFRGAKRRRG